MAIPLLRGKLQAALLFATTSLVRAGHAQTNYPFYPPKDSPKPKFSIDGAADSGQPFSTAPKLIADIQFTSPENEVMIDTILSTGKVVPPGAPTLRLFLDSGWLGTTIFRESVDRFKIDMGKPSLSQTVLVGGVGENTFKSRADWYADEYFNIGYYQIDSDLTVMANPLPVSSYDGALGAEIFQDYVVEIDYPAKRVRLYDRSSFQRPVSTGYVSVPLTIIDGEAVVDVDVTPYGFSKTTAHLEVDTGSGGSVGISFTRQFAEKHDWARYLSSLRPTHYSGIGGDIKGNDGRLRDISIANITMGNPIAEFAENHAGALSEAVYDGLLGNAILQRFDVIFDFNRSVMYLKPGPHSADRFDIAYNYGYRIKWPETPTGIITIDAVEPGGGCEKAGVRVGDILEKVDGIVLATAKLEDFDRVFDDASPTKTLTIRHKGETTPIDVVVHGTPF